jgi:hypothetical protein
LIICCLLAHTTQPYLYNSTLISLQLFKLTPISLQLDLWLIWTLSHDLYLFELQTWSYSDSNSIWSPPQPGFQLNWIHHPWTLLGSVLAYLGLDSFLLELNVLILLWTQTPSQFGLVSSIFFLNSFGQLTRVTFTLSAYTNLAWTAYPNSTWVPYSSLTRSHQCLPGLRRSYPTELPYPILLSIRLLLTRHYMVLPDRVILSDLFPVRLLPIRSYPATLPDRVTPRCTQLLTRPYPITLPGWVPFNYPHPKISSSASHLDLGLLLVDNALR